MDKNIGNLSKLDPSEALGTDAILQVLEFIGPHNEQMEVKLKGRGKRVEKPIPDPHRCKAEINPDNSDFKKELREKAKMQSRNPLNEGEKKESWARALQLELEEDVRKFRMLNRKKNEK